LPPEKHPKPFNLDWKPGDTPTNIVQALLKCEADIVNPDVADSDKAIALAWILHLSGDIHQPMHTTSWYSPEHPDGEGDRRGNYTYVNTGTYKGSLHALWDNVLGKYVSLDATRQVVDQIRREHPRTEFADLLGDTDFKSWAAEGHAVCKATAYMNGEIPHAASAGEPAPSLPKSYLDDLQAVGRKRIALAGYRLADQLNRLFGDSPSPSPSSAPSQSPATSPATRPAP
jgi:hypothetical protein